MDLSQEGQSLDKKSLRAVTGKNVDWRELAKDCVAFANSKGGRLLLGIEDDSSTPPTGQRIPEGLTDTIQRKIADLTVNVSLITKVVTTGSGDEYVEVGIPRSTSLTSTTDGRYFVRIADQSRPVTGDDVLRLASERPSFSWETLTTGGIPREEVDEGKWAILRRELRNSDRVKPSVKEKSDDELLDHYQLANGPYLTNLGILCVGQQSQRARLGTAPVIQYLKFDDNGQKVHKLVWDDHTLNPMEMIESVWREVPDFREHYELPDGLYRHQVPAFDEVVVRELLVNAIVHRPYTHRGDIFLNIHPDRLEIVNPGPLPLGVTPKNILHSSVRRNEQFARLLHDLKLMEREGSGFDRIFEILVSQGRPAPELSEGEDSVRVIVGRRILKPEVIDFLSKVDRSYPITQRERIALGLLAQNEAMSARELAARLELNTADLLQSWIKRLLDWRLVQKTGRTQSTRYFVDPQLLKTFRFVAGTTLKRIEPHRLAALILEDIARYPGSKISELHTRIGAEIPRSRLRRALRQLVDDGKLRFTGIRSGTRYEPR